MDTLPSNYLAEKEFLACLFLEPGLINLTSISENFFIDRVNKKIFSFMKTANKEKKDITVATISDYSDSIDSDYLRELASFVYTTSSFQQNERLIIENYNRRQIIRSCQDLVQLAKNKDYLIDQLLWKLSDATNNIETMENVKTLSPWIFETYQKLFEKKESVMITEDTGFSWLNTFIWGYRAGSLYVVGARPSVGKSTFMLNMLLNALKQDIKCCVFSLEMPAHEIHVRMMSNISQVDAWLIEKGEEVAQEKVIEAVMSHDWYDKCNIYDDVRYMQDIERLIAKEAALWTKIVFIDYTQIIKSKIKHGAKHIMIGEITSMLKHSAIKYGIAIVTLAQLNRDMLNGIEPELKHLKDSGDIEQDADVVMFLHWDENTKDEIQLLIKKNRHGQKWYCNLAFKRKYFKMTW